MFKCYSSTFIELKPSEKMIFDYLQISSIEEVALVETTIVSIYDKFDAYKGIVGGYKLVDVVETIPAEGVIHLQEGAIVVGKQICGYLKDATQLALFLCTAGPVFTDLTHFYQKQGDFLEAYLVDAMGSIVVEKAMDKIQASLDEEMKLQGLAISNRYSPGYCNWALSTQKELFKFIGEDHQTEITLSDSCLMEPIKSISGIIGIGSKVKKRPYACSICENKTCVYRRINNNHKN